MLARSSFGKFQLRWSQKTNPVKTTAQLEEGRGHFAFRIAKPLVIRLVYKNAMLPV